MGQPPEHQCVCGGGTIRKCVAMCERAGEWGWESCELLFVGGGDLYCCCMFVHEFGVCMDMTKPLCKCMHVRAKASTTSKHFTVRVCVMSV